MKIIRYQLKKLTNPFFRMLYIIGFNPKKLISLKYLKKFYYDKQAFIKMGGGITHSYMILEDFNDQAGTAKGQYFHQDLLVASLIYKNNPERHIDVGSRIDGFVAHVASFRPIEVFDIRKLEKTGHDNIIFKQANLMELDSITENEKADSISCLHAIEHFGLGRYGDPVDPMGHIKGFQQIIKMLKSNGILYISFPIGKSNQVHFNAHRVFHPQNILTWFCDNQNLKIERFDYVDDRGYLHKDIDLFKDEIDVNYGCGIYTIVNI